MRRPRAFRIVSLGLSFLLLLVTVRSFPDQGDRIDATLFDGRTFKNVEVIKAEGGNVLVWTGSTLTSFKLQEARAINRAGASPTPAPEPAVTPPQSKPAEPTTIPPASAVLTPSAAVAQPAPGRPATQTSGGNNSTTLVLLLGLIAAVGYGFWQRRARQILTAESKRLDAFANELKTKLAGLELKYGGLLDADKALDERKLEFQATVREIKDRIMERERLKFEITDLRKHLSLFEGEEELVACGHYRPTFDFATSDEFKKALETIRDAQRDLIKNDDAAYCSQEWSVNGSKAEGKKATKRTLRLMLRAFNGESDALIARVSWNNIDRMLERLEAAYEAINKLGESYNCAIARDYMVMKERELKLTFEYENKLKQERDEQRELKERMRDEERARREMEEALKQTALDEARAEKALDLARAELTTVSAEKEAALNEKILALQGRLEEALKNKERALSRAQQTRSGHVYVISNIGSFGETVFKIGMTRRLDPLDRVQELGDASVPFGFDIHAMIYTDDAPALEAKLHKEFHQNRVNLINERKEFFHTSVDELEAISKKLGASFALTKLAEAREYRETVERRKALKAALERA